MQISAPTNFDFELIDKLKDRIHDTCGSLNHDPGETVLPSYALPKVSMERLKKYIEYSHARGIKFNYIMNHPNLCPDKQRIVFLDKLEEINVDIVTISNPKLISYIKKEYPFKICSSIACKIDSVERAMMYKDFGCDILCLDDSKNNDLEFIKLLKTKTELQIKILANNICLPDCPYREEHFKKGEYFEKEIIKCLKLKLNDISLVAKTGFIYPDDLKKYEDMGVDFLKLGGRTKPTQWIVNCVEAYSRKNHKGNYFSLANTSVFESKYSPIFRIILKLFPDFLIKKGVKWLYFLSRKEIFKVFSKEKNIKSLLRIYFTKGIFCMNGKKVSIDREKKDYLLKEVNKILEEDF